MNRIKLSNGYVEYAINKSLSHRGCQLLECAVILFFIAGKSNFAGILLELGDIKPNIESDIESQFKLSSSQCDYLDDISLGISEEFIIACKKEIETFNIGPFNGMSLEVANMSHSDVASSNSNFRIAVHVALRIISQALANKEINDNYILKSLNEVRQFNLK